MGYQVTFDRDKCQGYANCLIEAPAIWDFDEDEDVAVLRQQLPGDALRATAESAARGCPAQAIGILETA